MTPAHILRDRTLRRFAVFLALIAAALPAAALAFSLLAQRTAQAMLLERDGAVASALLAQGMAENDIAAALAASEVSGAGRALLARIGRTAATPGLLLPELAGYRQAVLPAALAAALLQAALLLGGALVFARAQAARLAGAERLLRRYAEGDFSARLPRDAEGPFASLFAAAEELATMLQAKTEAEHRARQFLKQTIADISHQLKTPLAALGLYQEIIAAEPDNADAVRAFAGKAGDALLRMESLIQAMLKITRLDAGSIRFAPAACPLPDLAGRAVRDLLTRAEREGKRIRLEGDPALTLWCDPDWTAEALGNLVKNGLDHTAEGGLVQVTWRHTPGMVQVQVADNGSGIAPEDIHHIFKRFYRGRSGPDARGAGLGLPLARAIVEGQGGAVTVQSTPGQGSVFAVSFPDGPDGLTEL